MCPQFDDNERILWHHSDNDSSKRQQRFTFSSLFFSCSLFRFIFPVEFSSIRTITDYPSISLLKRKLIFFHSIFLRSNLFQMEIFSFGISVDMHASCLIFVFRFFEQKRSRTWHPDFINNFGNVQRAYCIRIQKLVWRCTIKAICIRSIRIEFAVCSSSSLSISGWNCIRLKLSLLHRPYIHRHVWMHACNTRS